ncbi:MAG TPA: GNAT family N-acetyltransferase [Candidatus Acidoferrum sp.]|nr:GNAT family N-acetyltransferase [Candidatus Acidoferrum sp.]
MSRSGQHTTAAHLEPWGPDDLPLLEQLLGNTVMMTHLGGPETPEKIAERHQRYQRLGDLGAGRMFKIVDDASGDGVGSVGYWPRSWRDQEVYEMGWSVLPAFQGRGIAAAGTAQAIVVARSEQTRRFLHAFPSVANEPSNAICRKVGFELVEACDFEYPPGHVMRCNDWRLDLTGRTSAA